MLKLGTDNFCTSGKKGFDFSRSTEKSSDPLVFVLGSSKPLVRLGDMCGLVYDPAIGETIIVSELIEGQLLTNPPSM